MLRLATTDDARAIALVHIKSWQAIYRGRFPDQYLDSLNVDQRAANWARILSQQPEGTVVFERDAKIVGFLSLDRSRDQDADATVGEITSVYLDPDYWRRGHGSALIEWAKGCAHARGWQRLTLWVLRENEEARDFYAASGFAPDGATKEAMLGDGTSFVEMRYALPA